MKDGLAACSLFTAASYSIQTSIYCVKLRVSVSDFTVHELHISCQRSTVFMGKYERVGGAGKWRLGASRIGST